MSWQCKNMIGWCFRCWKRIVNNQDYWQDGDGWSTVGVFASFYKQRNIRYKAKTKPFFTTTIVATDKYGSRGGTIQKYFANPKKYFKSQCFSQITVEKFDKSKKPSQILRKFVDPQITFSIIRKYFANP